MCARGTTSRGSYRRRDGREALRPGRAGAPGAPTTESRRESDLNRENRYVEDPCRRQCRSAADEFILAKPMNGARQQRLQQRLQRTVTVFGGYERADRRKPRAVSALPTVSSSVLGRPSSVGLVRPVPPRSLVTPGLALGIYPAGLGHPVVLRLPVGQKR